MYHPNKHMTEQSSSNPFSLSNSELDPSCYFWFFVVKLTEIWCVEVFMCACMLPVIVLMKTQLISCSATDLQVWQVTYSLMYLLNTFSMCFCWNRPWNNQPIRGQNCYYSWPIRGQYSGQSEDSILYLYLDDQLVAAVNSSACSQLSKQEEKKVLGLPMDQSEVSNQIMWLNLTNQRPVLRYRPIRSQYYSPVKHLGDLVEVCKRRLLTANPDDL